MNKKINPFHDLYVTEIIPSKHYVNLFSSYLVSQADALFKPGNVVLKGVQGCGKSMLLSLIKPEIINAYHEAGIPYPVPYDCCNYIGAGINLTYSQAFSFGQRLMKPSNDNDFSSLPLYFADYVNYIIIADILRSIKTLHDVPSLISKKANIDIDLNKLNKFATVLAGNDCWFGYFKQARNYNDLLTKINEKITFYRRFINFNTDEIPKNIEMTKTMIGEPISVTARLLKENNIISSDTIVVVAIDQYEELYYLENIQASLGADFRRIINKALVNRDPNVNYRIGTRGYAWHNDLSVYGSTSTLELERNYKVINLDEIFRRKEYSSGWIFPKFAEDVFKRRLDYANYNFKTEKNILSVIFGNGLSPKEKAIKYAGKTPESILDIDETWPEKWVKYLKTLSIEDPLSAKLGEAWARQKDKESIMNNIPSADKLPWEEKGKQYWKKERVEQALLQIAGKKQQNLLLSGKDDVIGLSGGNILVFVSICQSIWSVWLQTIEGEQLPNNITSIKEEYQAIGILEASKYWYNKITEPYEGNKRQRFIAYLGTKFNKSLYQDKSMSYPGNTGFSIIVEDIEKYDFVKNFLNQAVDFSDLFDADHTTKTKDRRKRKKWYIKPILCPYFKIPYIKTKEPLYIKIDELLKWLYESKVITKEQYDKESDKTKFILPDKNQLSIF